jgi:hypothetical protein
MFKNDPGKLLVYAPRSSSSHRQRLLSVKTAAEDMARELQLDFEMVSHSNSCLPIYVYYKNGAEEDRIPVYCDEGKTGDLSEISSKIRGMMFVLSFHPRHLALRRARGMLIEPS